MEFLSHTPPNLPDGSLQPSSWKRGRWGGRERTQSISGRLRSASDLLDDGVIGATEKGVLKDMIIANDPRVDEALRNANEGNFRQLQQVLADAKDKPRHASMDLVSDLGLDQLDLNFFDMPGSLPKEFQARRKSSLMLPKHPSTQSSPSTPYDQIDVQLASTQQSKNQQAAALAVDCAGDQFPFDDDIFNYVAASTSQLQSDTIASHEFIDVDHSHELASWDQRGLSARQRLPSQSGSFSTFFSLTPPVGSSLDTYAIPPASLFAAPLEKNLPSRVGPLDVQPNDLTTTEKHADTDISGPARPGSEAVANKGSKRISAPVMIPKRVDSICLGADGKPVKKMVGNYSPDSRRARIARFMAKRHKRIWTKRVKYDVRKNFADSRLRVKGRFVKKEDEELLRELLNMT